jgi:hypothetical protein
MDVWNNQVEAGRKKIEQRRVFCGIASGGD